MTVYFRSGPGIHGPPDPRTVLSALVEKFQLFLVLIRSGARFQYLSWSCPVWSEVWKSPLVLVRSARRSQFWACPSLVWSAIYLHTRPWSGTDRLWSVNPWRGHRKSFEIKWYYFGIQLNIVTIFVIKFVFFSIFDQLTRNNGLKQWAEEGLSFIDQEYADAKACW